MGAWHQKNPVGRPPGKLDERDIFAESMRRADEANLAAQRSHRSKDIAACRRRFQVDGMSRKRLVEIYGRDVVDQALGTGST